MERLIKRWNSTPDGELSICEDHGVAYQSDMRAGGVVYDSNYLKKCAAYAGSDIARAVNSGRVALIQRHVGPPADVIDIGCGTGDFMRAISGAGYAVSGFDVIPEVIDDLRRQGQFADNVHDFDVVCMWDSLEHMEDPDRFLRQKKGSYLFVSIPMIKDIESIRTSKHYRPGEHLYYWTAEGFIAWIGLHGFRLIEISGHEVEAGREDIVAFAFKRDLPDYHDHIGAYKEIHSSKHYGASATELYLQAVASVVKELKPASIIDYGCGRSDLVAHFWLDGARKIARYDPAISAFSLMPSDVFDLVLATDVMEHIPMASVDRILTEIRVLGKAALFTISLKLARAKLPDGRNSHVTILKADEWVRWIKSVFGSVRMLESAWEHEIILLAGAGK